MNPYDLLLAMTETSYRRDVAQATSRLREAGVTDPETLRRAETVIGQRYRTRTQQAGISQALEGMKAKERRSLEKRGFWKSMAGTVTGGLFGLASSRRTGSLISEALEKLSGAGEGGGGNYGSITSEEIDELLGGR